MIRAADLTERVTIQEETRAPNGQGGYTTSWADLAADHGAWANVRGLSGNEAIQAGVQRSVQQWRVIIRSRPDVTTKHRLQWAGRALNITSAMPLPDQPKAFTLLICESGLVA